MEDRDPRAKCCSDSCRAAVWKARTGYGHQDAQRKPARVRSHAPRKPKPSDVRVTFARAVEVLGRDQALELLTPAQRAKVDNQPERATS